MKNIFYYIIDVDFSSNYNLDNYSINYQKLRSYRRVFYLIINRKSPNEMSNKLLN